MKKHDLTGALTVLIFSVFMVSILLVLLSGADIVQDLSRRDDRTYLHSTATQYITTRIRQADRNGCVSVDTSGAVSTLVLHEQINGIPCQTRVYCHDGYLREMFCPAGSTLSPEFGEEVLALDALHLSMEGAAVRAELLFPDGSREQLFILLRSEGGLLS